MGAADRLLLRNADLVDCVLAHDQIVPWHINEWQSCWPTATRRTTTYAYDGAGQLTGETTTGAYPYSLGFSYDGNGNRKTQTSNGQLSQSFVYDAHDKLTNTLNNQEVYGYDANGNQTGLSYYGSAYAFTFDDEDRLTHITGPNGLNDAFAYNGLGQRVSKTDSTGQFALVSDGASPAAPVIADGLTVFTPGLSSRRNGASQFRHGDLLGSLRFETDASQNVTANRLYSAFGSTVASAGDPLLAFGWVGDGESQTDADTGLVLMGHRLYDSRIGRFLSQDPAGDGDNWYAYAGNDPVDNTDPTGLWVPTPAGYGNPMFGLTGAVEAADQSFLQANDVWLVNWSHIPAAQGFVTANGMTWQMNWAVPAWDNNSGMGGGGMMIAGGIGMAEGGMGGIFMAHTKGARPSTEGPHQLGVARQAADQQKKEAGDITRARKALEKKQIHTGVSTRDPDGSLRRAREAEKQAEELKQLQREKQAMDEYKALSVLDELEEME